MRYFNVSSTLKSSVENVLKRRCIQFSYTEEGKIAIDMSGESFHKVVLRAKMEKRQEEEGSPVPYIAECEMNDPVVEEETGTARVIVG